MSLLIYNTTRLAYLKKVPKQHRRQAIAHIDATEKLLDSQTLSTEQLAAIIAFYIIQPL